MVLIDGTIVRIGEKVIVVETEKDGDGLVTKVPVFVEGKYTIKTGDVVLLECFAAWRVKEIKGDERVFELNLTAVKLSVARGNEWVELTPVPTKQRHNKR